MCSANRSFSCIDDRITTCFLSKWTPFVMKYVYTGPTIRFIHYYISVRAVKHEQNRRPDTVMDLVHCKLGKFLLFPTLVARWLYVCKDARKPSDKNWNYLSKVCHVMLQKWPLSRHLCKCFLPQMYDKRKTVTLMLSVRSMF